MMVISRNIIEDAESIFSTYFSEGSALLYRQFYFVCWF